MANDFDPSMFGRMPTLEEAQANAQQFAGVPQMGPEVSLFEQAMSAGSMPSGGVSPAFSMVPQAAPGPQIMRDPEPVPVPPAALLRRRGEAPQAPPGGQPRPVVQGGPSGTNPVSGMLQDATARRTEAEKEMALQEVRGDEATAAQQDAVGRLGAARAATSKDIAGVNERMALEGQTYQQRLAADQDSYERATAKVEGEQRELSKFISEYQPKDRRTTGKKVMSALAVGLSALGDQLNLAAGMNMGMNVQTRGAENTLSMIQRGIDRDLEEQRMMLDNKRTALAAKNTELGQARERFGDRMDSMKLARAMKLEQAAQEVEALKQRGMAPEHIAIADQTIAALGAQRADLLMGLSQQRFQQHFGDEQKLKMVQAQQAAAAARANRPLTAKEALELEGKALENEKLRRELGGPGGKPLTPEEKKQRSILGGQDSAARDLAKAIAGGDGGPGSFVKALPDVVRGAESLGDQASENAIIGMVLRHESGASISEGDIGAKRAGYGLDSSDPAVRLRGRRQLLEDFNSRRGSVGLDPISPVVRRGAAQ